MTTGGENEVFRMLANPVRRAIFDILSREGEKTVVVLTAIAGISQPGVSKHLAMMKQVGLVRDRQEGRETYYSAEYAAVTPLVEWARKMTAFNKKRPRSA